MLVSEYDAPTGCVEVAACERTTTMAATSASKRVERLFVQERFADQFRSQTFLPLGDVM